MAISRKKTLRFEVAISSNGMDGLVVVNYKELVEKALAARGKITATPPASPLLLKNVPRDGLLPDLCRKPQTWNIQDFRILAAGYKQDSFIDDSEMYEESMTDSLKDMGFQIRSRVDSGSLSDGSVSEAMSGVSSSPSISDESSVMELDENENECSKGHHSDRESNSFAAEDWSHFLRVISQNNSVEIISLDNRERRRAGERETPRSTTTTTAAITTLTSTPTSTSAKATATVTATTISNSTITATTREPAGSKRPAVSSKSISAPPPAKSSLEKRRRCTDCTDRAPTVPKSNEPRRGSVSSRAIVMVDLCNSPPEKLPEAERPTTPELMVPAPAAANSVADGDDSASPNAVNGTPHSPSASDATSGRGSPDAVSPTPVVAGASPPSPKVTINLVGPATSTSDPNSTGFTSPGVMNPVASAPTYSHRTPEADYSVPTVPAVLSEPIDLSASVTGTNSHSSSFKGSSTPMKIPEIIITNNDNPKYCTPIIIETDPALKNPSVNMFDSPFASTNCSSSVSPSSSIPANTKTVKSASSNSTARKRTKSSTKSPPTLTVGKKAHRSGKSDSAKRSPVAKVPQLAPDVAALLEKVIASPTSQKWKCDIQSDALLKLGEECRHLMPIDRMFVYDKLANHWDITPKKVSRRFSRLRASTDIQPVKDSLLRLQALLATESRTTNGSNANELSSACLELLAEALRAKSKWLERHPPRKGGLLAALQGFAREEVLALWTAGGAGAAAYGPSALHLAAAAIDRLLERHSANSEARAAGGVGACFRPRAEDDSSATCSR